ncbi:hypothetical protein UYSO10_4931 [Kosakonia radicincitans]|nr:hypothetical protein UYSO10_4931 [Kosakonia radicincitans]
MAEKISESVQTSLQIVREMGKSTLNTIDMFAVPRASS